MSVFDVCGRIVCVCVVIDLNVCGHVMIDLNVWVYRD